MCPQVTGVTVILDLVYRVDAKMGKQAECDLEVHWYTGTQVHWYTGIQVHWYTGTLIHRYTGTLEHRYTDTQVHWYAGH